MLVSKRLEGIYKFHGNNITCELPGWALRIPCPSNAWTTIIVKDAFFFKADTNTLLKVHSSIHIIIRMHITPKEKKNTNLMK